MNRDLISILWRHISSLKLSNTFHPRYLLIKNGEVIDSVALRDGDKTKFKISAAHYFTNNSNADSILYIDVSKLIISMYSEIDVLLAHYLSKNGNGTSFFVEINDGKIIPYPMYVAHIHDLFLENGAGDQTCH